jgi:hypothetical protein
MKLEKTFVNKKNEFVDSVNRWLAGSEKIKDNYYNVYNGETDEPAICTFNQNECYIKTATSGFLYALKAKENNDMKIIYQGAWYGLGKQEIIPEFLKDIDWTNSRVTTTSLSKVDLNFKEYKRIREEENEIRYTLHKKYGDQSMTRYRPGLEECSDNQLDEVFSQYKNWEYIIIPLSEDPFHQWDSNKYYWEKIVFIHMKRKTPFHMYRKIKK